MPTRPALALTVLALGLADVTPALALPPSRDEVLRRTGVVNRMKESVAAEATAAGKAAVVLRVMAAEADPDVAAYLAPDELARCFDDRASIAHVDDVIARLAQLER